jgi:hypothetical protein
VEGAEDDSVLVTFDYDNAGVIADIPDQNLTWDSNVSVVIHPIRAGHVTVTTNTSDGSVRWA